jgi:hypothetical protein
MARVRLTTPASVLLPAGNVIEIDNEMAQCLIAAKIAVDAPPDPPKAEVPKKRYA